MNNDRLTYKVWSIKQNCWCKPPIKIIENLDDSVTLISPADHVGGEYIWLQSTGLQDKNGKLIFEGDVVEGFEGELVGKILFYDEEPSFQFISETGMAFLTQEYMNNFEIIGNIYETNGFLSNNNLKDEN
jgi:hypothetical protein